MAFLLLRRLPYNRGLQGFLISVVGHFLNPLMFVQPMLFSSSDYSMRQIRLELIASSVIDASRLITIVAHYSRVIHKLMKHLGPSSFQPLPIPNVNTSLLLNLSSIASFSVNTTSYHWHPPRGLRAVDSLTSRKRGLLPAYFYVSLGGGILSSFNGIHNFSYLKPCCWR